MIIRLLLKRGSFRITWLLLKMGGAFVGVPTMRAVPCRVHFRASNFGNLPSSFERILCVSGSTGTRLASRVQGIMKWPGTSSLPATCNLPFLGCSVTSGKKVYTFGRNGNIVFKGEQNPKTYKSMPLNTLVPANKVICGASCLVRKRTWAVVPNQAISKPNPTTNEPETPSTGPPTPPTTNHC